MTNLIEIIRKDIPIATLERVVFDQNVVNEKVRERLFKMSRLSPEEIARHTVEAYGENTSKLAYGLYQQVRETDVLTGAELYEHFKSGVENLPSSHEASLVGHVPNLSLTALTEFTNSVQPKLCLVVTRNSAGEVRTGTGFLVGPDLVLTCRHVLRSFITNCEISENGCRIEFYFDFKHGQPIRGFRSPGDWGRIVKVLPDWHVESRDFTHPDGLTQDPLPPADDQRIRAALDFVLIRLEEKVGLQPVDRGGGRRRGWIDLPDPLVPQGIAPKDWIIIPQHPNGEPQRIDLGRFAKSDSTKTRIRYTTNTGDGSSGAPCFNQDFVLVGIHNAFVGPPVNPLFNQAIRFDHITPFVNVPVQNSAQPDKYALRWSIAAPGERPNIVLGRDQLLAWLRDSATNTPRYLSDRVYVAQASLPGAGCTFSHKVLHAEIRGTKSPRVVYAEGGQQLPATAEDFLFSLLRELGIDKSLHGEIPARPSASVTGFGALPGEIDKLDRWLSGELPDWLGNTITKHAEREFDRRELAKTTIANNLALGLNVPTDLEQIANSAAPDMVRQTLWDRAYVVIDCLRTSRYAGQGMRIELQGEVRSLLAALVQGKPEHSMHPGLKKLRWMFLGYLPDFLTVAGTDGNGATFEALDPAAVGIEQVLAFFRRLSDTQFKLQDVPEGLLKAHALAMVKLAERQPNADLRLHHLQQEVNESTEVVLGIS